MTGPSRKRRRRNGNRDSLKVALAFVERINAQDVDGLCALMTANHRFVDPTGRVHVGRERMRGAWRDYFTMFPDYRITISDSFRSGARGALFGTTRASYAPNGIRVAMHAAWRAVVRDKRLAEWRVCADNEPARAAMRR